MAYTTIDDGSEYFHTQLYTGDGSSSNAITNDANAGDFKPDWLWIKCRSDSRDHQITDSTRGGNIGLRPNSTIGEFSGASTQFDSDGFTLLDGSNNFNGSSKTYVAWQWKANGGTTSSNSDGDVTSTVQANTTAGFSIVTWTSTGGNESVGHGLGVTPNWFITKNRSAGANWKVYHQKDTSEPETNNTSLNKTDQSQDDAAAWNDTAPTSTTFTVGTDAGSGGSNGNNMVAYCFAEVKGYSKFGSYTGNGSTDGAFVYTGFRPQWILWKRIDSAADWEILDDKINPFNEMKSTLEANTSDAVGTETNGVDMLSNGFKHRNSYNSNNASGGTYIYMAFAENPFVSSKGVPVTAR